MILTKKYRLVWGDDLIIKFDYKVDWSGTMTSVGEGANYFESDEIKEIENKINDLKLIYNE